MNEKQRNEWLKDWAYVDQTAGYDLTEDEFAEWKAATFGEGCTIDDWADLPWDLS
jgi:hypothetical protein